MQNPKTMTPEAFTKASAAIAAEAQAAPLNARAVHFDRLADLWEREGFAEVAQTWRDTAVFARRTYGS